MIDIQRGQGEESSTAGTEWRTGYLSLQATGESHRETNCHTQGQFALSDPPHLCVVWLWEDTRGSAGRDRANSAQKSSKLANGQTAAPPCYYYLSHPVSLFHLFLSSPVSLCQSTVGE